MGDWIDLLQWPAMAASLLAAWLVGSRSAKRREKLRKANEESDAELLGPEGQRN